MTVTVKIHRVNPLAKLPAYATAGSVGLDLQSMRHVELRRGMAEKIDCGIAIALPTGYEAQIRPRSSLSLKGIHCSLGTIDEDFRGTLAVVLTMTSDWQYTVEIGDRIAQLIVMPVPRVEFEEVDNAEDLGDTVRGAGGYGSTGK